MIIIIIKRRRESPPKHQKCHSLQKVYLMIVKRKKRKETSCNIHQHTQRPTLGHRLCWLRACHPLAHGESESGSGPSGGTWRTPLVGRNPTGEHVSEAGHWLVKVVGRCVGWWESLTDWEEPVQTIAHCHLWKPALGVGNVGLDYHPCQFA